MQQSAWVNLLIFHSTQQTHLIVNRLSQSTSLENKKTKQYRRKVASGVGLINLDRVHFQDTVQLFLNFLFAAASAGRSYPVVASLLVQLSHLLAFSTAVTMDAHFAFNVCLCTGCT